VKDRFVQLVRIGAPDVIGLEDRSVHDDEVLHGGLKAYGSRPVARASTLSPEPS
jgi:hypothetical protein